MTKLASYKVLLIGLYTNHILADSKTSPSLGDGMLIFLRRPKTKTHVLETPHATLNFFTLWKFQSFFTCNP